MLSKFGRFDTKRARKLDQVYQRDIALAAFDAAYISAVQIGALSQFLLREARSLASLAQKCTEHL